MAQFKYCQTCCNTYPTYAESYLKATMITNSKHFFSCTLEGNRASMSLKINLKDTPILDNQRTKEPEPHSLFL